MQVSTSSYRDEQNNIIDDLDIEGSVFDRLVVLRNNDGSVTVRAKTDGGETVEETFERTHRQFTGLSHGGGSAATVHEDIKDALFSVGYTVEPPRLLTETIGEEDGFDE